MTERGWKAKPGEMLDFEIYVHKQIPNDCIHLASLSVMDFLETIVVQVYKASKEVIAKSIG